MSTWEKIQHLPHHSGVGVLYFVALGILVMLFISGFRAIKPATLHVHPEEVQIRYSRKRIERYPLRQFERAFLNDQRLDLLYEYHSELPMNLHLPRKWFRDMVWFPMIHLLRERVTELNPGFEFELSDRLTQMPPIDADFLLQFRENADETPTA